MKPTESIDRLVADGIVDEVVQRVKTGKEAEVFVVRKGTDYFAAKVYKERHARNFRNNAGYREGRAVRNTRDMRAMAKGTKYGVEKSENEWMHTEHDALVTVSAAGVRVPKAELFYEGVLVMELVLGADGQPAPRLIEVPLSADEALAHHRDLVGQIVRMLTCDLVHGDLSPYNILMAWNGPTIIDLPQVVKAAHNTQAEQYLVRDVRNVTEHFAKVAPQLKKRLHDGYAIWKKYMARELTADFFPEEGTVAPQREFVPGAARAQNRPQERGGPRPQGERPPGDRPQGGRPHGDRPQGDRPQGGPRPQQGPRPQEDRPPGDRPHNDRPRPDRPHSDRPHSDRPQAERSHGRPNDRPHARPNGHGRPSDQRPLATPHEPRPNHAPRSHAPRTPQVTHAPVTPGPAAGAPGSSGSGGGRFSNHHRRRPR